MSKTQLSWGGIAAVLLFVIVTLFTGIYTVDTEEVMVIQRFGKYRDVVSSGMHFKIPYGVDVATSVPQSNQVLKEEFGYRTVKAGEKTEYSTADFTDEMMMLTGDEGIVLFPYAIHYTVVDPKMFLFNHVDVKATFRKICQNSMLLIVGDHSYDEAIIFSRNEIMQMALMLINEKNKQYKTGLHATMGEPQDVSVHPQVKEAFNAVNDAIQEMSATVNNAYKEYNSVIPKARGTAEKTINEAMGYKTARINNANGNVSQFTQVAREWNKSKEVTETRLRFETIRNVLPNIKNKVVVDEDLTSVLPMLNLNSGGAK